MLSHHTLSAIGKLWEQGAIFMHLNSEWGMNHDGRSVMVYMDKLL